MCAKAPDSEPQRNRDMPGTTANRLQTQYKRCRLRKKHIR